MSSTSIQSTVDGISPNLVEPLMELLEFDLHQVVGMEPAELVKYCREAENRLDRLTSQGDLDRMLLRSMRNKVNQLRRNALALMPTRKPDSNGRVHRPVLAA
jgi:hypothetical protein